MQLPGHLATAQATALCKSPLPSPSARVYRYSLFYTVRDAF